MKFKVHYLELTERSSMPVSSILISGPGFWILKGKGSEIRNPNYDRDMGFGDFTRREMSHSGKTPTRRETTNPRQDGRMFGRQIISWEFEFCIIIHELVWSSEVCELVSSCIVFCSYMTSEHVTVLKSYSIHTTRHKLGTYSGDWKHRTNHNMYT